MLRPFSILLYPYFLSLSSSRAAVSNNFPWPSISSRQRARTRPAAKTARPSCPTVSVVVLSPRRRLGMEEEEEEEEEWLCLVDLALAWLPRKRRRRRTVLLSVKEKNGKGKGKKTSLLSLKKAMETEERRGPGRWRRRR